MSCQTISWVVDRRYGDPLLRLVMLTMAMDSGMDRVLAYDLSKLAAKTEIRAELLPEILTWLVDDGHLRSWSTRADDGCAVVTFPADAFPELDHPEMPYSRPRLRKMAIAAFEHICSYCHERGDERNGPDGTAWHLDRIVAGGHYHPENVTLACRPCNMSKRQKRAPEGTRSLADVLRGGALV